MTSGANDGATVCALRACPQTTSGSSGCAAKRFFHFFTQLIDRPVAWAYWVVVHSGQCKSNVRSWLRSATNCASTSPSFRVKADASVVAVYRNAGNNAYLDTREETGC